MARKVSLVEKMSLHARLDHYVTEWDRKESTKRYYNAFALGIYLERAERVSKAVGNGERLSIALEQNFCDRLLTFLTKKFSAAELTSSNLSLY
jgi:hypothetical protein